MTMPPGYTAPPGYVPPPARNAWIKPLLIGCGSLFVVLLVVGGVGAYFAVRAVGSAIHRSTVAAHVAERAARSAEQAVQDAGASPDPEHEAAAGVAALQSLISGGERHVPTLTRQELKAALQNSVDSLVRTSAEASTNAYAGIGGNSASASYGTGSTTVSIDVTDAANMSGLTAVLGLALDMKSEDDDGHEKGADVGGVRVHEKWTNAGKASQIVGIIGDRFFINVNGRGLGMKRVEKAFATVDIAKLQTAASTTK